MTVRGDKVQFFIAGFSIAATYVYFLIFAQFAFLFLAEKTIGGKSLTGIMVVMGLCGFGSSLATSSLLKRFQPVHLLRAGFGSTALVAFATTLVSTTASFLMIAAAIGLTLGLLTVTLGCALVDFVGSKALGPVAAWGTGSAYAVCNFPPLFNADLSIQCLVAGSFGLIALELQLFAKTRNWHPPNLGEVLDGGKSSLIKFLIILASFFLLIWLDASLFFIIQQTDSLKSHTWIGGGRTITNGLFHLAAALITGYYLRKKPFHFWIFLAFAFLAAGSLFLANNVFLTASAPLYVVGVSIYSTCLVAYPGLFPEGKAIISRAGRTALVFGLAGWVGSAMGIGMAKDLHRIPILFLAISGVCFFVLYRPLGRLRMAPLLTLFLIIGLATQIHQKPLFEKSSKLPNPERGRQVYISEGCIHCHSQYVRPDTQDELLWGPVVPLQQVLDQSPALIGNRRLGPDLLNVGNRRGWQWQRLHLENPRALSPQSIMPGYAHLFEDQRGEDLIAYLQSLGQDRFPDRQQQIRKWKPEGQSQPSNRASSCNLFIQDCAPCHGISGNGRGELADAFPVKPRNLLSDNWVFLPTHENDQIGMARTIKFGIPGTNMPGHEHYNDAEILGLVNYLNQLRQSALLARAGDSPARE